MKRLLVRVALSAAVLVAMVQSSVVCATEAWVDSTITGVFPVGSGYFVLYFASGSSCGGGSVVVKVGENDVTADGIHMLLSVALTAFTTTKHVQVAYDNVTSQCYANRIFMLN